MQSCASACECLGSSGRRWSGCPTKRVGGTLFTRCLCLPACWISGPPSRLRRFSGFCWIRCLREPRAASVLGYSDPVATSRERDELACGYRRRREHVSRFLLPVIVVTMHHPSPFGAVPLGDTKSVANWSCGERLRAFDVPGWRTWGNPLTAYD